MAPPIWDVFKKRDKIRLFCPEEEEEEEEDEDKQEKEEEVKELKEEKEKVGVEEDNKRGKVSFDKTRVSG